MMAPAVDFEISRSQTVPVEGAVAKSPSASVPFQYGGRSKVFCKGKLVTGAASTCLVITLLLVLVPLCVFCVFLMYEFVAVITVWPLIPVFYFVGLSVSSLLVTAFTDPGVLPRDLNPRETLKQCGSTDYGEPDVYISRLVYHEHNPDFLMGKEIIVNGVRVMQKYCNTCQIFRPPRASHCSYCDNCVEEFDHHCPWVANCIGRRNYRYFVYFLITTGMLCAYVTVMIIVYINQTGSSVMNLEAFYENSLLFCFTIYTGLLSLPLLGLSIYHLYLIANNMTTSEQVKMSRSGNKNSEIATATCGNNFARTFCRPRPSRTVPWKMYRSHNIVAK